MNIFRNNFRRISQAVLAVTLALGASGSASTVAVLTPSPAPPARPDVELQKLELERLRVEGDLRLREKEIQLRRDELQAKQKAEQKQAIYTLTSVTGPILVGVLGLFVTWFMNKRQNQANYETQLLLEKEKSEGERTLEKQKFQSELISKMIETGNQAESAQNLLFLIRGGLIEDPEHKIEKLASEGRVAVLSPRSYVSGQYKGIPPEGVGGRDPELNVRRNRDLPPDNSYAPMKIADIIGLKPVHGDETLDKPRSMWSSEARNEIGKWESKGISVEAYVRIVKQQASTSAFGNRPGTEYNPIHLLLVGRPEDGLDHTVIAEVTPRVSQDRRSWNRKDFMALAEQKTPVRVSGWLLWEQFHSHMKVAGTFWRISPVLEIEVQRGGEWISFSDTV